ncbi:alpha/beta hydrolase [Nocardioides aestuarii]|uniref:Alpha/beta fold hydrolase n=1 Tax=Nocardioides aestuarii TaxID=252231 RepID=A0ABW4TNT0_9ACTN
MRTRTLTRRPAVVTALAVSLLLLAALITMRPSAAAPASSAPYVQVGSLAQLGRPAAAPASESAAAKPTVVLVHGAFADSSGWNDVSLDLQKRGYTVRAWSNPLRGLAYDAEYLRLFLTTIEGPIILVGHSYGGAVITEASTGNEDIVSLVYVSAYALDEGEDIAHANSLGGGHSTIIDNIVVSPYPNAPEGDGDAVVKPKAFRHIFAKDLPRRLTKVMAVSQRPSALSSLVSTVSEPGWETIPSYYLVAKHDHLIPPEAQRVMADRAGATTAEVDSSHVIMMSKPQRVVNFVLRADREH